MGHDESARDWMAAAAGNEALAEELRTGRCRCGTLLREESPGCRWHESGQRRVGEILSETMVRRVRDADAGRREDLELLGRFLPARFLAAYEILIHRGVVVGRSGRGYDESALPSSGRRVGGLGSSRSEQPELRLVADLPRKKGSSRGAVIRDENAVDMRRRIDGRLRRMAREIVLYLEAGSTRDVEVRRCSGKGCKKWADEKWMFCPSCGSSVVASREEKRRGPRH